MIVVSAFFVLWCWQTDRQTDADERYTPATLVGVSSYCSVYRVWPWNMISVVSIQSVCNACCLMQTPWLMAVNVTVDTFVVSDDDQSPTFSTAALNHTHTRTQCFIAFRLFSIRLLPFSCSKKTVARSLPRPMNWRSVNTGIGPSAGVEKMVFKFLFCFFTKKTSKV